MKTEETRALIERYLAARAANDAAALERAPHRRRRVAPAGRSADAGPFIGREKVLEALTGGVSGSCSTSPP